MARLKEDIRRIQFWRSVVGEFVGSLFIVLIGCGASVETDHAEQPVTVRVALAFGVTYAAGLYCLHSGNDGHLNTSVTVAMAVTRRVSVIRCLLYVIVQLIGSVVGASTLYWITSDEYKIELGSTRLSKRVSEGQGFLVEFFATSVLVFVVFASYDERNKDKIYLAPFVIGLTLTSVSLFSIYWFGPILGGVAGGLLHELLFSVSASCRRVRQCLLLFERRRRRSASKSAAPSEEEDDHSRRSGHEASSQLGLHGPPRGSLGRTKVSAIAATEKEKANFEVSIDGSLKSWERSKYEEEEDDDDEEEDEEDEEESHYPPLGPVGGAVPPLWLRQ